MIVVAGTSGIIAASDRNARESAACREVLQEAGTVIVSPLVLTEVDHLAKARFGSPARTSIIDFILTQARQLRFQIPHTGLQIPGHRTPGPAAVRKPGPGPVAHQLGQRPQRCAAAEDSANGLRLAASAGLQVIAIPHPRYPPDPTALQAARLVLTSLAELTTSTLTALAGL